MGPFAEGLRSSPCSFLTTPGENIDCKGVTAACEVDLGRPWVKVLKALKMAEEDDFLSGVRGGGAFPGDGDMSLEEPVLFAGSAWFALQL